MVVVVVCYCSGIWLFVYWCSFAQHYSWPLPLWLPVTTNARMGLWSTIHTIVLSPWMKYMEVCATHYFSPASNWPKSALWASSTGFLVRTNNAECSEAHCLWLAEATTKCPILFYLWVCTYSLFRLFHFLVWGGRHSVWLFRKISSTGLFLWGCELICDYHQGCYVHSC